jgi:probable phosphoglycerate mutase
LPQTRAANRRSRERGRSGEDNVLRPGVTLYFVRHGETDWNVAQRYQGRRDIPLNATGRTQARRNGRVLAELLGGDAAPLDYVASPLLRARETMEIVRAELQLLPDGYRTDERLSEIDYGHWEGRLLAELPCTDPEGFAARKADAWAWQPAGGESYRMLSERVAGWLAAVERDAVVVSHGGVSKALRGLVLPVPRRDIPYLEVPQDKVLLMTAGSIRWI